MTNPMFPPVPFPQYASRPNPGPGFGPSPGAGEGPFGPGSSGNSGNGHGPMMNHAGSAPPARADVDKEADKKKKKGWFGRS